MQWGYAAAPGGNVYTTVTFPETFTNIFSVYATNFASSYPITITSGPSTSSVTFDSASGNSTKL